MAERYGQPAGPAGPVQRLAERMLSIDRRIVYLLLAVGLSVPYLLHWKLPINVEKDAPSRRLFETIESLPSDSDKVVLVITQWGPGTKGENEPQFTALIRHLVRSRKRFALISTTNDYIPIQLADSWTRLIVDEENKKAIAAGRKPFRYGIDWIDLGFNPQPLFAAALAGMGKDIHAFAPADYPDGKPVDSFPIMEKFRGLDDIAMVLIVSAGAEPKDVLGIWQRQKRDLLVGVGTMSIVATEFYSYYDSGQLCGMLDGKRGADEYRYLLGLPTLESTNAMTVARLLILLLVVVGNVAQALIRGRTVVPKPPSLEPSHPMKVFLLVLFAVFAVAYMAFVAWDLDSMVHYNAQHPVLQQKDLVKRVCQHIAALCTFGILAFLLGDNLFYRVFEHILAGSALAAGAYMSARQIMVPKWYIPIRDAFTGAGDWKGALWLLMLIPGALWYFTYSKRYNWISRIIIASFMGIAVGLAFGREVGLAVPQIVASFKPFFGKVEGHYVFAWDPYGKNIVFVVSMVLVLWYFVFFIRHRSPLTRNLSKTSRWIMMAAFGAWFANTVGTRLSWLIDRVDFLLKEWLQIHKWLG